MDFIGCLKDTFSRLNKPAYSDLKLAIQSLGQYIRKQAPDYITEPQHFSYGREVLFKNDELEAILIHMPAGEQTFIHDHGDSIGCVYVVEGELINQTFTLEELDRPVFQSENRVAEGEFIEVTKGLIHRLKNPTDQRFISFHVYSPPLEVMNNYEICDSMGIQSR